MRLPVSPSRYCRAATLTGVILTSCVTVRAQSSTKPNPSQTSQTERAGQPLELGPSEVELRTGIALTSRGLFAEAIPHFLAAQGRVSDEYAADFNLSLCYVATGQYQQALAVLSQIASAGRATAGVYNLLAQTFIGMSREQDAIGAFQKGVARDPKNERLYLLAADACIDHQSYELGLEFVDTGLQHLPRSARLHYERGVLLSLVDQPDRARGDLRLARELAKGTSLSFLADAQEGLLNGTMDQAIRAARDGLRKEPENYVLLTILGQALMRQGSGPGQPEFDGGRAALEKSVALRPNYAVSQLALGQMLLLEGHLSEAITHLEKARELAPNDPSTYSRLAVAYRQRGDLQEADKMLAVLTTLNKEQAAKYKLDPPDHKGSYLGSPKQ